MGWGIKERDKKESQRGAKPFSNTLGIGVELGMFKKGETLLHKTSSPSPLKERGIKGVR